MVPEGDLLTN